MASLVEVRQRQGGVTLTITNDEGKIQLVKIRSHVAIALAIKLLQSIPPEDIVTPQVDIQPTATWV